MNEDYRYYIVIPTKVLGNPDVFLGPYDTEEERDSKALSLRKEDKESKPDSRTLLEKYYRANVPVAEEDEITTGIKLKLAA